MRRILTTTLAVLALTGTAVAQDADGDGPKKPSMHELYHSSSLPRSHADFSRFKYRPPGDKVVEQPDAFRLLFRTRDGQPDGYAERRGDAVIYYDRYGKVTHVQPLAPDDETPN
ncbi:hypothetical protein JK203_08645 [Gluconobacter cerinus]|uniref:Uncharacterized protein n=1 Tax=Gluconobacter cerinus TaxID=38307 RepID=A0A1B6VJH9_9PROT|nr:MULTISPECIES: hypothetical protein [Gluconobacter]MBM3097190.1 hypothetical protein [Gluconobacter cerinus]MBS0982391.1 hypothetical protein [Gluconobacter cerinus]MBS0993396.1 hypothetical protein [Gluconobacter cerinus]MBS1018586.1 hypothetical protein [Gluconobacter cerinus]MBS1021319.1 hypothetical protein [Gluconobacter cerinus]